MLSRGKACYGLRVCPKRICTRTESVRVTDPYDLHSARDRRRPPSLEDPHEGQIEDGNGTARECLQ
jgi:hypothetical protein